MPELIRMHQSETPASPAHHVKGIDPLVESVIAQCLEKDPKDRPQSALQVAMALPGGNPLQIALDAGQTPSPEMVAASPKKGSLRPVIAFSLLAAVFIGFAFATLTSKYTALERNVPLDKSADVLQERGREIVKKYGYTQIDSHYRFTQELGYINHLNKNDQSPGRWQHLAIGQPAVIQFWYRTSPNSLAPLAGWRIEQEDPPEVVPGMVRLRLDTKGRLTYFKGVPPRVDEPSGAVGEFDWAGVFKDAGFYLTAFESVEPQWTPPNAFDERRAFSGRYPDAPEIAIRIEAAAYRGKLVHFDVIEPWTTPPGQTAAGSQDGAFTPLDVILVGLYFGVLFFSGWLAVRNIRGGRSDVRGAIRIVLFLFAIRMIIWVFTAHHIGGTQEIDSIVTGLESALYWAAVPGLMYLAFEPYMRKSAPERVISWNRLLGGDWRDPLVGRDVLIGAAAASVVGSIALLLSLIPSWLSQPSRPPGMNPANLYGIGGFPAIFLQDLSLDLFLAFILSFLLLFSGLLLR